jgi:hypothetical protein
MLASIQLHTFFNPRKFRSSLDSNDPLSLLSNKIPEERLRERDLVRNTNNNFHLTDLVICVIRVLWSSDAWHVIEQVNHRSTFIDCKEFPSNFRVQLLTNG